MGGRRGQCSPTRSAETRVQVVALDLLEPFLPALMDKFGAGRQADVCAEYDKALLA